MNQDQILFAAGVIGIVFILYLGIGFFKSQPKNRSAQLFFAISICGAAYILKALSFHTVPEAYRINLTYLSFLLDCIPAAIPPLFMMYCLSIFQENKRIPWWLVGAFIFHMVLLSTWVLVYDYLSPTPSLFATRAVNTVGNYLIDFMLLAFSLGAVYWTVKDWRNDLIEGRRILRWLFVSLLGIIIFLVVVSENFLDFTDRYYAQSQHITIYVVAVFCITMALLMTNFDYTLLGDVIEKVGLRETSLPDDKDIAIDLDDFRHQFIEQKLYRQNGLTIAALADKLSMPEYRLRGLINKHLGYRNFSAMLHHYRIEDASQTLADRSQKNIPILTVALNVGYNSITPFNTAFRDLKGLTPSEFRKKALQNQLHPSGTAA